MMTRVQIAARNIRRITSRSFTGTTSQLSSSTQLSGVELKRKYNITREDAPYALGKHRSNALELIEKQPVIEVDGPVAVCDGGGGVLGHPLEYIKLDNLNEGKSVVSCVYCGLKYKMKDGHH